MYVDMRMNACMRAYVFVQYNRHVYMEGNI